MNTPDLTSPQRMKSTNGPRCSSSSYTTAPRLDPKPQGDSPGSSPDSLELLLLLLLLLLALLLLAA